MAHCSSATSFAQGYRSLGRLRRPLPVRPAHCSAILALELTIRFSSTASNSSEEVSSRFPTWTSSTSSSSRVTRRLRTLPRCVSARFSLPSCAPSLTPSFLFSDDREPLHSPYVRLLLHPWQQRVLTDASRSAVGRQARRHEEDQDPRLHLGLGLLLHPHHGLHPRLLGLPRTQVDPLVGSSGALVLHSPSPFSLLPFRTTSPSFSLALASNSAHLFFSPLTGMARPLRDPRDERGAYGLLRPLPCR